ncbi:MAG: PQQ-dependent sugar dehydrogenase [Thermodesulfobacteriota bacterium]
MYRLIKLFFLLMIILAALAYYYRYDVRAGFEYARSRLLPDRPAAGSYNASFVNPWVGVKLMPYLSGFELPVYLANPGDGSGRVFVVEKAGLIKVAKNGKVSDEPFLDIVRKVGSKESEQGLLSVAFHPNYKANGRFFVNYTDLKGDTVVSEFKVGSDPDRGDADSERVLLKIKQPASNHNGGQLQFGPDGYLYIGTGDGGFQGDPSGNGQDLNALLGKMLRIDVDGGEPYGIPPDNPFRNVSGTRPEIWAYGLRNPWRFSFDSSTGDMYIGDVGEGKWEEVDYQPRSSRGGENYGWSFLEGSYEFKLPNGYDTKGLTFPVAEYSHEDGCSVTGGYVYRGGKSPGLKGTYFFSDYCSGKLWGLRKKPGGSWEWAEFLDTELNVSSFGVDEAGEIYILDLGKGGIYRIAAGTQ